MSSARRPGTSSRTKKPSAPSGSGSSSRERENISSSRQQEPTRSSTARSATSATASSLSASTKPAPQEGLMEIVQKRFVKDVFESASSKYHLFALQTILHRFSSRTSSIMPAQTHSHFPYWDNPRCRGLSWLEGPYRR